MRKFLAVTALSAAYAAADSADNLPNFALDFIGYGFLTIIITLCITAIVRLRYYRKGE